ncbi:uncharacterized protein LOC115882685 [Sitophilus oryzae]|uniref:Uncharacterized protein LOC115882685 n=1 Tax=Sitophilus oryzae TaxID=7048 RepID=A0A6J2XZ15_SITOR|nr:uncharacterized protein LOC115882685 [Sitophilus oryzae]
MSFNIEPRMLSRSPGDDRRFCDSGSQSEKSATGHTIVNDQAWCGKLATGHQKLQMRNTVNIGTWNVQGLKTITGKLAIIESELSRYRIEIAGLAETYWLGEGYFKTSNGNYVYFSGNDKQTFTGVAILISARIHKSVIEFRAVNDRIVLLRLDGKPHKFNIIQIYAPTATAEDNEIKEFYNKLELTIRNIPNKELTLICGDFNAKVGNNKMNDDLKNILGKYSLGERNERGDRAICGSDHQLLFAKIKLKLKTPFNHITPTKLIKRNSEEILQGTQAFLTTSTENTAAQEIWEAFKKCTITATESEKEDQPIKRKHWLSNETFQIIEDRRLLHRKSIHTEEEKEELKYLNKAIKQGARRDKQQFYSDICKEIEGHSLNNQPRDLFKKIKYIIRDFKARNWAIEDQNGTLRTKKEDIIEVWRSYCEDLYKASEQYNYVDHHENSEKEPDILKSEVELAINKLKYHKAPGSDLMTAEIIKAFSRKRNSSRTSRFHQGQRHSGTSSEYAPNHRESKGIQHPSLYLFRRLYKSFR